MRHDGFPMRLFSRQRVFGARFLPLMSLLLALAFSACGGVHECFGPIVLSPPALTVANGIVYTQGAENISALRADAGSVAWRSDNGATLLNPTAPVVADGFVIASIGFGALVAHHLSDGSLAWHSQAVSHLLPGSSQSPPSLTVADGIVYAAASPDTIAAWRVADGTFLWQSPSTNPTDDSRSSYTQTPDPVIAGNVVYFFARDAELYAIRIADGSLLWSILLPSTPNLSTPPRYAPPVIADGRLFMVLPDGSLYALNAATGAVLWHSPDPDLAIISGSYQNLSYSTRPAVSGAVVYYATLLRIRALDAATGHPLWRFPMYMCHIYSAPVVTGGVIYGALEPSCTPLNQHVESGFALTALDAHTGAMQWIVDIQSGVSAAGVTVLVNGGAVYTISGGKSYSQAVGQVVVAATSASTGASLWQRTIRSSSADFRQVAYADGVIYLSTEGVPGSPQVCSELIQPVISALRASDGALLWQTAA